MKIFFTLLLSTLFSLTLSAYEVGDKIDITTLKTLQLKSSKIYIIDFFASWCGSCEKELPELNAFNKKLDTKKYELIGIDIDKDVDNATAFQEELAINFRVINDTNQNIVSHFKPLGMPSIYIVKDNTVIDVIVGAKDSVDELLRAYLKGIK